MIRTFLVLFLCVFFFSCGDSVPKGIIKQDKMERVLFDTHVVDGYISLVYPEDSAKKVAAGYYRGIYKKFDTDSAEFNNSLAYYTNKPKLLDKMYKNIAAKLNAQKKYMQKRDSIELKKILTADSIKLKAKAKTDSIKLKAKAKTDSIALVKKLKTDSIKIKAKAKAKAKKDSVARAKKLKADSLKKRQKDLRNKSNKPKKTGYKNNVNSIKREEV